MALNITDSQVRQYKDNIELVATQLASKLRVGVTELRVTGKDFSIERLANPNDTMGILNTRHAATVISDLDHSRRVGFLTSYIRTYMIDDEDKVRMLADPTSSYMQEMAGEFNRTVDGHLIKQFLENANTGETGSGTQALPSDQVIAHGGVGLTLAKLKQARRILDSNDVDTDREDLFVAVNAQGQEDLMTDTGVVSIDNVNFKTNESGRIETRLAGFQVIMINKAINDYAGTGTGGAAASSNRPAIAFARSAMHLGLGKDIELNVREMTGNNLQTGLFLKGTFGAVRAHDEKVVDIRFQES